MGIFYPGIFDSNWWLLRIWSPVLEGVNCRLQGAGHCFIRAETTQTFINANIKHKNIMFKPLVSIFVKVWVVSVRVKE